MKTKITLLAVVTAAALLAFAAPSQSAEKAESWEVDAVHSSVIFKIKHLNVSWFYGRFNKVSGQVTLDPSTANGGSISVEIDADSVDTANAQRDGHLKGTDFFNVKQFPTIRFQSTKVTVVDDTHLDVTGKLTMHGVTKDLKVRMERTGTGKGMRGEMRAGFAGEFTIDRTDYGIDWRTEVLGKSVTLMLGIECTGK
jgi:polyisoprenoid-binding protein YceI